jgi:hypothetical protein
MLLRTIYMNRIVNFKGNRAERHACASSNICRMPYAITVCAPAGAQNKQYPLSQLFIAIKIKHPPIKNENSIETLYKIRKICNYACMWKKYHILYITYNYKDTQNTCNIII